MGFLIILGILIIAIVGIVVGAIGFNKHPYSAAYCGLQVFSGMIALLLTVFIFISSIGYTNTQNFARIESEYQYALTVYKDLKNSNNSYDIKNYNAQADRINYELSSYRLGKIFAISSLWQENPFEDCENLPLIYYYNWGE